MRSHPRNKKSGRKPLSVVYSWFAAMSNCTTRIERVTLQHWNGPLGTDEDIEKLREAVLKENEHHRHCNIQVLSWQRFDA